MRVVKLRKDIQEVLKSIHSIVHYEHAPDNATYPFLVYNLTNSIDDGTLENFVLEIDAWDNQSDTTRLERLIGNVDNSLHRRTVAVGDMSMTFYRENRLTISDKDKNLRRRQYVYQVRVYGH